MYHSADLLQSQLEDSTISEVLQTQRDSSSPPQAKHWLRRYRQLWIQLQIVDGVLCRTYTPSPHREEISVPVLPESLWADASVMTYLLLDIKDLTRHSKKLQVLLRKWRLTADSAANASSQNSVCSNKHP